MDTLQRLRRLLSEILRIGEDDVRPNLSIVQLFDRHGGDSLDRAEFVMAIEEEFDDLQISDEEAARWEGWIQTDRTVQQLAEFIDHRRRPPA